MGPIKRLTRPALCAGLLALALFACVPQASSAASVRISRAAGVDGRVLEAHVSPNDDYAVYVAYKNTGDESGISALYSVSLAGGEPVALTGALPEELHEWMAPSPSFAAGGTRVLYIAEPEGYDALYSVPTAGGAAPVRLSKTGEYVDSFMVSPDGSYVLFETYTSGHGHLYRADPAGAAASAVEITPPGAASFSLGFWTFSPDSQYFVFFANLLPASGYALYQMPRSSTGAQYTRLSPVDPNEWFLSVKVTPDGQTAVYEWLVETSPGVLTSQLYAVPVTGPYTSAALLSGASLSGSELTGFKISPDSRWVVFGANRLNLEKYELFSTALHTPGAQPARISVDLPAGRDVGYTFSISPDSARVVYSASKTSPHDIFSAPIHGSPGDSVQLNQPGAHATGWADDPFLFTPDSRRVIYMSTRDNDLFVELFSVPVLGPASASLRLNPTFDPAITELDAVRYVTLSADGQWVFFTAPTAAQMQVFYRAPVSGGAGQAVRISERATGVYCDRFELAHAAGTVIYREGTGMLQATELFKAAFTLQVYLPGLQK